jgi:hypothetical protein
MPTNIVDFESAKIKRWAVGGNNRGHDHIDYAVIIDGLANEVIIECSCFELAAYIVRMHNENLKKNGNYEIYI